MNSLLEMFSYSFMTNALAAGLLISLSASLIGIPLVLRHNSMLGDGLSHVSFGIFAILSCFGLAPLWLAIPLVVLVSFFILRLNQDSKLPSDSIIAIMSASALAIGTFAVSLAGSNVDINAYLFGSILTIGSSEIILSIILATIVLLAYLLFHNKIFAVTFDQNFAKAIGINTKFYNIILAILCSVVVVVGMRLMGALLISSLIVFPVLSARSIFQTFQRVTITACLISMFNFFLGLILSYLLATPTGATIVIVNLFIFIILSISAKIFR